MEAMMNEIEMVKEAIRVSIITRYKFFFDRLSKEVKTKPLVIGKLFAFRTAQGLSIEYNGRLLPQPSEIEDVSVESDMFSLITDVLIEAEDNGKDYWREHVQCIRNN